MLRSFGGAESLEAALHPVRQRNTYFPDELQPLASEEEESFGPRVIQGGFLEEAACEVEHFPFM